MPLHAQAWQQALAGWGIRVSRREIYLWEGESGIVSARTLLARRGRAPSPAEIRALLDQKQQRFARLARRVPLQPLLPGFVRHAARCGVPLALVTGTSWEEVQRVVPRALRLAFRVIITGDRVRRGKPHPEPYLTAMRQLGVAAARTIVVENAPYGLRSARAARAGRVIAIASSLPKRFLHEAHEVSLSFEALRRRLHDLLGDVLR